MPVADDVAAARREARLREIIPNTFVNPNQSLPVKRTSSRSKSTVVAPSSFGQQ